MLCVLLVGQHFAQYFPFFIPPTLVHSFSFAGILLLNWERLLLGRAGWFQRGFIPWLFGEGKCDYFSSDLIFDLKWAQIIINVSCTTVPEDKLCRKRIELSMWEWMSTQSLPPKENMLSLKLSEGQHGWVSDCMGDHIFCRGEGAPRGPAGGLGILCRWAQSGTMSVSK